MKHKAFTLLEILLVIAAIGILVAIVIVAINPQRQLAQVRNSERVSDSNTIQKGITQYLIDEGTFPASINTLADGQIVEICAPTVDEATCISDGLTDISAITPRYLAQIPTDPNASGNSSGYALQKTNDTITIFSLNTELNLIPPSAPKPTISTEGLVGRWQFEEGSGTTAADSGPIGNNGSFTGGNVTWSTNVPPIFEGVKNHSLRLEGDGGRVQVPHHPSLAISNNITLSFWVSMDNAESSYEPILARTNGSTSWPYDFWFSDRRFTYYIEQSSNGGGSVYQSGIPAPLQSNQWHYVTVVRDGNIVRHYLDGEFIDQVPMLGAANTVDRPLWIGTEGDGYGLSGNLHDVRIYNRPLTALEVKTLSLGFE